MSEGLERKEKLCQKAESLSGSTDWKGTNMKMQELQKEWKKAGYVPREQDQVLWQRFRSAIDGFYANRNKYFEGRDNAMQVSLQKKERLCQQAEVLRTSTDWKGTQATMKRLQNEWKNAGSALREQEQELWERFRAAVDEFYANKSEFFHQKDLDREQRNVEYQQRQADREVNGRIGNVGHSNESNLRYLSSKMIFIGMRIICLDGNLSYEMSSQVDGRCRYALI